MTSYKIVGGLKVATQLYELIEKDVAPGTGVEVGEFWRSFESIVTALGARNRALLDERAALQTQIDDWHVANPAPIDLAKYRKFLESIGYILPEPKDFKVRLVEPYFRATRLASLDGRHHCFNGCCCAHPIERTEIDWQRCVAWW
jgi:malate synthase